jgi:hypothetical protein
VIGTDDDIDIEGVHRSPRMWRSLSRLCTNYRHQLSMKITEISTKTTEQGFVSFGLRDLVQSYKMAL